MGPRMIDVTCPICGHTRSRPLAQVRFYQRKGTFTGACPKCNIRNQVHSAIRGRRTKIDAGRWINQHGYVMVYRWALPPDLHPMFDAMYESQPGKKQAVVEHRLIMATHLGRPLDRFIETVHHKNGKRTDNRLENLRLYKRSEHHNGFGDFYQEWQEALSRVRELEQQLRPH